MGIRLVTASSGDDPPHDPGPFDASDGELADWLRGLVWTLGPVAPTTHVHASRPVELTGVRSGGIASGRCVVTNRQRAAVTARLAASPLRNDEGFTWFPTSVSTAMAVVPAAADRTIELAVFVPPDLPTGTYRGSLIVLGMSGRAADLVVEISDGG